MSQIIKGQNEKVTDKATIPVTEWNYNKGRNNMKENPFIKVY